MEIPTLQTDRLLLRPFSAADVDAYAELNANQEVMRYIDKVQDREAAFRSLCANIGHWHVRGYGPWALEDRATGRLIGRAGVLAWEGKPGPEVGYALHPSVWGKGYGREAAARCLHYAHETIGARGVLSVIHPDNAPSIRVAVKLGAFLDREEVMKGQRLLVYRYPDP